MRPKLNWNALLMVMNMAKFNVSNWSSAVSMISQCKLIFSNEHTVMHCALCTYVLRLVLHIDYISRKACPHRASLLQCIDDSTPCLPMPACCVTVCWCQLGGTLVPATSCVHGIASMHRAALIRLYRSMECRPASGAHANADRKGQCYACSFNLCN